jgi:hypothetical protein
MTYLVEGILSTFKIGNSQPRMRLPKSIKKSDLKDRFKCFHNGRGCVIC